jgi:hypothetical protein
LNLSHDAGSTCSLNPPTVTLTQTSSFAKTLLSCKYVSAGAQIVTVTATNTIQSNSTSVMISIQDFTFSINQNSIVTNPNNVAQSTVTVSANNGFKNDTLLSYTIMPSNGLYCSLDHSTITGGTGNSQISCHGSPGAYIVSIQATAGSIVHSQTLNVSVIGNNGPPPPTPFNYWPYVILSGALTVITGLTLSFRRRK